MTFKDKQEKLFEIVDGHDSFEDYPWALMYEEIDRRYPGSKFILTTRRSSDVWFESLTKHAKKTGPTIYRRGIYGHNMPADNPKKHVDVYETHNQTIREYFNGRQSDFLEVCWENGDGWEEICNFLQHPIPNSPFPHENKAVADRPFFSRNLINRIRFSKPPTAKIGLGE